MPGIFAPDKEPIGVLAPRTLKYKIQKEAARVGRDMSVLILEVLEERFGRVALSGQDYEQIARATRDAERSRRRTATKFVDSESR